MLLHGLVRQSVFLELKVLAFVPFAKTDLGLVNQVKADTASERNEKSCLSSAEASTALLRARLLSNPAKAPAPLLFCHGFLQKPGVFLLKLILKLTS
jgi:hypothetical protein